MRETKKFFYNNRLNKGYSKISNNRQSIVDLTKKQDELLLPPVDIMEAYEEQYPGTFQKLFDMAQKEQNHRHAKDLMEIETRNKEIRIGKIFALSFVLIVILGTIMLVNSPILACFVAVSAFTCITVVSYLSVRANCANTPKFINPKQQHLHKTVYNKKGS